MFLSLSIFLKDLIQFTFSLEKKKKIDTTKKNFDINDYYEKFQIFFIEKLAFDL